MRSILEELWYGNVCPNTGCRESTTEAKQLMGYIADHHDNLLVTLTDKQKEILECLRDFFASSVAITIHKHITNPPYLTYIPHIPNPLKFQQLSKLVTLC